jgi:hypothetical protein
VTSVAETNSNGMRHSVRPGNAASGAERNTPLGSLEISLSGSASDKSAEPITSQLHPGVLPVALAVSDAERRGSGSGALHAHDRPRVLSRNVRSEDRPEVRLQVLGTVLG